MEHNANKTIITVVGKDTVGIIAKVCTYLSENGVNVLDISQTIVSGYFNMMICRLPERSGCIGRGDRRIDQVPESRDLRYDAQNLGRKAVND